MLQETSRQPGQWVRAQARVHERRVWMLLALVFAFGALVVRVYADERRTWLALIGVAFFCFLRHITRGLIDVARHWDRGASSEEAVGDALDALVADGFTVNHDLRQEFEGNVDHLVTGRTGVFMIETKHRGYKQADLSKAKRQAKKLNDELGEWVTPVICLDRRRARAPYRDHGVWIVSRERLAGWIREQH
jgi:nuclease-like protein